MNKLKSILIFSLVSLILCACELNKTEKKDKKIISQIQPIEKNPSIISDSTNKLTNKIESLEVAYTVWGCACPQWIRTKDLDSNDTTKKLIDFHFYIEPASKKIELPTYFDAFRHNLKIEGQFYEKEDYPQGTIEMEEPMPKAKVFRYTKIDIIDKIPIITR